ncbi:hypothetical protein Cadr_000014482 [Camelus dromedarius]|uniref:Uncharacterized protein n=1 Tax=Camelus dromedarius TaxID=9838 RepID=A0A5N4DNA5_CAMDR|nr:hypothetical protein Cadr_000014482 [Camelus dromedarius]
MLEAGIMPSSRPSSISSRCPSLSNYLTVGPRTPVHLAGRQTQASSLQEIQSDRTVLLKLQVLKGSLLGAGEGVDKFLAHGEWSGQATKLLILGRTWAGRLIQPKRSELLERGET